MPKHKTLPFRQTADKEEAPTTQRYMEELVYRVGCEKHDALLGDFCFEAAGIASDHPMWGVCNDRAKQAGFNAPINPLSLTSRPFVRKSDS